jgi:hypothetical protein
MHALLIPAVVSPLAGITAWIWPHVRNYARACRIPEHEDRS